MADNVKDRSYDLNFAGVLLVVANSLPKVFVNIILTVDRSGIISALPWFGFADG